MFKYGKTIDNDDVSKRRADSFERENQTVWK